MTLYERGHQVIHIYAKKAFSDFLNVCLAGKSLIECSNCTGIAIEHLSGIDAGFASITSIEALNKLAVFSNNNGNVELLNCLLRYNTKIKELTMVRLEAVS